MAYLLNLCFIALLEAEEKKGGLLDVNPGLIIWTAVTFIALLIILKITAWKPILGALDERERFIKESLEKSEKARDEAERLLQENKANLARAEEDAQKIIEQGREFAEKLKNQMLSESKEQAKKIIDDASSEIKRKNEEAFNNLRTEIGLIAVQAAEKILRENLDKDKQLKIANKFIDELPKN